MDQHGLKRTRLCTNRMEIDWYLQCSMQQILALLQASLEPAQEWTTNTCWLARNKHRCDKNLHRHTHLQVTQELTHAWHDKISPTSTNPKQHSAPGALGTAEEQAEETRRRGDVCVHAFIGIRAHAFKGVDGGHDKSIWIPRCRCLGNYRRTSGGDEEMGRCMCNDVDI